MTAVDNSTIKNVCKKCDCTGFVPALTLAYNATAKTLTVTDATVFSAADAIKNINLESFDDNGNSVKASIAIAGDDVVLDVSTLNPNNGLHIKANVSSDGGCVADGSLYKIPTGASAIANWNKTSISSEVPN